METIKSVADFVTNTVVNTTTTISETPFVKDVKNGGIVMGLPSAIYRGYERESLKFLIEELENKFILSLTVNIESILAEYDELSDTYQNEDLIKEKRSILAKNLEKTQKLITSASNCVKLQDNVNINDESHMYSKHDYEYICDSICGEITKVPKFSKKYDVNETKNNNITNIDDLEDGIKYFYVSTLENGKYFVGITLNAKTNYYKYFDGSMHEFTIFNKPITVSFSVLNNDSPFYEDMLVKEHMLKYGILNVRGGSYSSVNLSAGQILSIQKELMYTQNLSVCCYSPTDFESGDASQLPTELPIELIDPTLVSLFIMHEFSKLTVDEISNIKQSDPKIVEQHLDICKSIGLQLIKR